MKKHTTILIALLLCVTVLCGCGSVATGGGQKGEAPVTAETVDANLRYFLGITDAEGNEKAALGDMGDRTPTNRSVMRRNFCTRDTPTPKRIRILRPRRYTIRNSTCA